MTLDRLDDAETIRGRVPSLLKRRWIKLVVDPTEKNRP